MIETCFYSLNNPPSKTPDSSEIGGKAANLIRLSHYGFNVPNGIVVPVTVFEYFLEENNLSESYQQAVNTRNSKQLKTLRNTILQSQLPEQLLKTISAFVADSNKKGIEGFAVRSSGVSEDLNNASFAGLYHTHLNAVGIDQVCNAVKNIWASTLEDRVLEYFDKNNIPGHQLKMAVIVQTLINSDKSGVAFSTNPITGHDQEVLVEACRGLGEALVSGEVTPDRYRYHWFDEREVECSVSDDNMLLFATHEGGIQKSQNNTAQGRILSKDELKTVCEKTVAIQSCYGYPIDIEWAIKDQTLYILQARPITQINFAALDGEWTTADFKDGGVSSNVCTPFMWSLYDYIWESTLPAFMNSVHLLQKDQQHIQWGEMFFGRPYWNLSEVKKSYSQLPGYVERSFDEDVGIEICYEGTGEVTRLNLKSIWKGLTMLRAFSKRLEAHLTGLEKFKLEQEQYFSSLENIDYGSLNQSQRFQHFKNFIQNDYYRSEAKYFIHIFHTSIATSLFKETFRKTKSKVSFIELISGLKNVSHLKLNNAIWQFTQKIKQDSAAKEYWLNTPLQTLLEQWSGNSSQFHFAQLRLLIDQFRYHSTRELDITVPRYAEDPGFILNNIQDLLKRDESKSPCISSEDQFNRFEEERDRFLNGLPFWQRAKVTRQLQQLRNILWWREELRDLSTQCYYYVRKFALELAKDFIELGIISHAQDVFWLSKDEWISVIDGELTPQDACKLWQKRKSYYDGFRNFSNPNEIGSRFQASAVAASKSSHIHTGVACSPGIVEGKVKVISDIFDANRLEQGDILITRFTDPGWTPKFSLIAGVATETGGVLSHAAVISREYGIPAVLAIKHLTQSLSDGDLVRVDGESGTVEVLEKS